MIYNTVNFSGRLVASKVKEATSLCLDTQAHEIASVPSASAVISVQAVLESCKDVSDLQQWYVNWAKQLKPLI